MTDKEIQSLTSRYQHSMFVAFTPREDIVDGRTVPVPRGDELVAVMEQNIRTAEGALRNAKVRHERAREDGLFDPEIFKIAPKKLREALFNSAMTVRGDLQRAISEVAHWQEYVQWAWKQKQRALPQREPGEDDE